MLLTTHGKVMISLEGRCICPVHGVQGPDVEYEVGFAPCGCAWLPIAQSGPDMLLHVTLAGIPQYRKSAMETLRAESCHN
jgi:hypothetical protein